MFTNPITTLESPDPAVTYHEGWYYVVACHGSRGESVVVMKSKKLQDVFNAERILIYTSPGKGRLSFDHWAPELWYLDGKWYIYTCATDGITNHTHRVIVLEGTTQNPQDPFFFAAELELGDYYGIDASILNAPNGKRYLLWSSCKEPNRDNSTQMYIAEMENPIKMKIPCDRLMIKDTDYPWEKNVIEGAACLVRNGVVSMIYSANAFDFAEYCLGMMICRNAHEENFRDWIWEAIPYPVFAATEHVWGPGHNTFTTSPDGSETWMLYHSKTTPERGVMRVANAKKIQWQDNVPVLGEPISPGVEITVPSGQEE